MHLDWFKHNGSDTEELMLQRLRERLHLLHADAMPSLSFEKRGRIRVHMFERIQSAESLRQLSESDAVVPQSELVSTGPRDEVEAESYLLDRLISWMKGQAQKISLDVVRKAMIRERLMELPLDIVRIGFFRRFAASLSLGGVLMMSIFTYMLRVPVTFAEEFTVVHEIEGDVSVVRDGSPIAAKPGMELQEGDQLQTGSNGQAVVRYFDKSFTRFFANTGVGFDILKSEDFGVRHHVELDLQHGRVWSNVLDFVTNSEFTVRSGSFAASASKRATFSVSSDGETSQVQVFQNAVNVEIPRTSNQAVHSRTVVNGYQAVVPSQGGVVVKPLALQEDEKVWVSQNLVQDERLIGEATKDSRGVVAGPSNVLQENASLLLAFSPDEKYRLELRVTEKAFYDILKKDGVSADEVRGSFASLESVVAKSNNAVNDDSKKMANAVLQFARNELLQIDSDYGLYALKLEVEDRLLASSGDSGRDTLALGQASQFLIEAQLLREKGLLDDTKRALDAYRDRMKLLADADDLRNEKSRLEKLYLAFINPESSPIQTPTSADVGKQNEITVPDVSSVASEANVSPVVTDTDVSRLDDVASKSSSSDVLPEPSRAPEVSGTEVALPPKLQLGLD